MARPGDTTSPFNQVVDKTKVHPRSQAKVDWLISFDDNDTPRGLADLVIWDREASGKSAAHALCTATTSDPEYTIRQHADWFPQNNGQKLRIPRDAEAGQDGWDYQLSVKQPDGSTWELYKLERDPVRPDDWSSSVPHPRDPNGGDVWMRACGRGNPSTLVSGYGEATQGHFDLAAGQITGEEMAAGKVNHALFAVVPGMARSGFFVEPVPNVGGKPRPPVGGTDKIEVGQRLFLNMGAKAIEALAIQPWEKAIYKALARYGAIVADGGGPSTVLLSLEPLSGSTYTAFGKPDPWVAYAKQYASIYKGGYVLRWTQGVIDWRTKLKVAA